MSYCEKDEEDKKRVWGKKDLTYQKKKKKTVFQQYGFFQYLFCVIMFSSIDSLFFSKNPYYSGCYSVA